jgi:ABC-type transporter Mla MlaB component
LASALLLLCRATKIVELTLKITIQERAESVSLKIEGRVVGPTVRELNRTWQELAPSLASRKLFVDLRGVTFIDAAGRIILAEIHCKTNAGFLADTPLTKYFAEEATQGIRPTWI